MPQFWGIKTPHVMICNRFRNITPFQFSKILLNPAEKLHGSLLGHNYMELILFCFEKKLKMVRNNEKDLIIHDFRCVEVAKHTSLLPSMLSFCAHYVYVISKGCLILYAIILNFVSTSVLDQVILELTTKVRERNSLQWIFWVLWATWCKPVFT